MKIYWFILMSVILMAADCSKSNPECPKNSHGTFDVINNSSRIISYKINWNYPNPMLDEYSPLKNSITAPNENSTFGAGIASCWESNLDMNEVSFYIFDQDSLQAIPWETVRKTNRGLLEKRVIDIDYLNKNNWTITYQ